MMGCSAGLMESYAQGLMESPGLMESRICIQSFLSMLVGEITVQGLMESHARLLTVLGLMESYAQLIEGVRVEGTLST